MVSSFPCFKLYFSECKLCNAREGGTHDGVKRPADKATVAGENQPSFNRCRARFRPAGRSGRVASFGRRSISAEAGLFFSVEGLPGLDRGFEAGEPHLQKRSGPGNLSQGM